MRKTRLGRLMAASCLALFVVAYAAASVAPALIALSVVAYLAFARLRMATLRSEVRFHVRRDPPDRTLHQGEEGVITTELLVTPPGLRVRIDDPASKDSPAVAVAVHRGVTTGRGTQYRIDTRIMPRRRGRHRLRHLRVELSDPDGLFIEDYLVHAPVEYTAHAPRAAFQEGRRVRQLQSLAAPRSPDPGDWSDEVLTHRDYLPGDRPRDIDWKASARRQHIMTRVFLKEVEKPLIVILDAGRTMRHRSAGTSMMDDGARFVGMLVGAALRQSTAVGLIAHDDHKVIANIKPSRDPALPRQIDEALAELPDPVDIPAELDTAWADQLAYAGRAADTSAHFDRTVAPFLGGAGARVPHGLSRAIHLAAPTGSTRMIVAFTDLQHRPGEALVALSRARSHQHDLYVALPFAPWYHLGPNEVDPALLESVHNAWQRQDRIVRRLQAAGITVIPVAPETGGREVSMAFGRGGRLR